MAILVLILMLINLSQTIMTFGWENYYGREMNMTILKHGGRIFARLLDGKLHKMPDYYTAQVLVRKKGFNDLYNMGKSVKLVLTSQFESIERQSIKVTKGQRMSYLECSLMSYVIV